jgi:hypothetical protein
MLSLRRWLSLSLLLGTASFLPFSVVGCSSEEGGAVTGDGDEIVNIPHTDVKNQSIGNCWTYATIGWVESMHLRATGNALNLSESYLTYWDWYEKLIKEPGSEQLKTGGWFTTAVRLFDRYGLVDEGVFIPEEAEAERSARQSAAEAAINASMKDGALKKSRDPRVVRDELNKAWKLSAEVASSLNEVFGEGTPKVLTSTTKFPAKFPLRRTSDIDVLSKRPGQAATKAKLKDVMGRWQEFAMPSSATSRRAYLRRVQKALHDEHPVIIVWDVSWGSRDKVAGSFPAMKADAKIDGRHMTILEDYQATNVPNFGLLPAGVTVTDTKTLNAALASQSTIQFFRVKNSWGQTADPSGSGQFKGYVDLYGDYLWPSNGAPNGLVSFIFPSEYTDALPSGIEPDRCATVADGAVCGAVLTSNESDKRLFVCKEGKTAAMTPCAGGCSKAACLNPPPPNPCEEIGVDVPGLYCGDTLAMIPSDPGYSNLYSCQIDPTTKKWISPSTPCPKGCAPQPPGVPDRCKLTLPGRYAPASSPAPHPGSGAARSA